jgi:hypothetical protein
MPFVSRTKAYAIATEGEETPTVGWSSGARLAKIGGVVHTEHLSGRMALVIPGNCSTFGDSTLTEGPLRKYVLAQFRSDADLSWVAELRSQLATDELKFRLVHEHRVKLKQLTRLWSRVERGVAQATLVVSDPAPVAGLLRRSWDSDGAIHGVDYDDASLTKECAAALVSGTPIAHLPNQLATVSNWRRRATLDEFAPEEVRSSASSRFGREFAPESIQEKIGDGLKAAQVFAARAHATFDVASLDETARSTSDAFRSPLAHVILRELLSTQRVFDNEDPKSTALLNRASEAIAERLRSELPNLSDQPLVREHDSRAIDHLQAADVAAGWAREMIDTGSVRSLGAIFERVWVNGFLMKGTHD